MMSFMNIVSGLWSMCEFHLMEYIQKIFTMISRAFSSKSYTFVPSFYKSEMDIFSEIQREYWCEEVFEEETGFNLKTLEAICQMATKNFFYREFLLEFLNSYSVSLC